MQKKLAWRAHAFTTCDTSSPSQLIAQGETAAYVRDEMGHSGIKATFDTYGRLFPGRGKEASARYEKSMADAKVRQNAEASVSNPLAIDWEEAAEGTVTKYERPER